MKLQIAALFLSTSFLFGQNSNAEKKYSYDDSYEQEHQDDQYESYTDVIDITQALKNLGMDDQIKQIAKGNKRKGNLRHARLIKEGGTLKFDGSIHLLNKHMECITVITKICTITYNAGATFKVTGYISEKPEGGCNVKLKVSSKAGWVHAVRALDNLFRTYKIRSGIEDAANQIEDNICKG